MLIHINLQASNDKVFKRVFPRKSLKRQITVADRRSIGQYLIEAYSPNDVPAGAHVQVILTDNTGWNQHDVNNWIVA